MKLKGYPDSVCDISEADFWSAMAAGAPAQAADPLARAVALGRAGKKARAYRTLADHHRNALAEEWRFQRRASVDASPAQAEADARKTAEVLRHRIPVWHTTVVDFGKEIDWDYGRTDKYGFHYLSWLTPACRHFARTQDARCRQELIDLVTSYYAARNRLHHPSTAIHLVYYELGSWAKLNVLLPLYLELLNTGDIPVKAHEAFMKLFLGFARSLYRLQRTYRGGNWQIVGCSGLLTMSLLFPEFRAHHAWRRRALKFLMEHVNKDFYADGCHKERCWGYGFMSLNGLTRAYDIGQRHGGLGADAAPMLRRIRQAFRWFARTLGPNELKPAWGDCRLSSGAEILDAAQKYFPPGTDRALGVDRTQSCFLKPSGFAILRNGNAPDSTYLNMSFGPFAGWHSHMDTLALNLWSKGQPLLEEVGRFGGYGEALTVVFRAPESHNQLTLDAMHYDTVEVGNRTAHDVVWHTAPEADVITAWHQAYRAQPHEPQSVSAVVRRTVVFVKDPGYAVVFDSAHEPGAFEDGPHFSLTQNWHSPFPFQVLGPALARTKGKAACALSFARADNLRRLETGADFSGAEATATGDYPERHHLRARRWMDVDYRGASGFGTLLYPFVGRMPELSIRPLPLKGAPAYRAEAFEILTPAGRDVIVLNPEALHGLTYRGKAFTQRAQLMLGSGRGRVAV